MCQYIYAVLPDGANLERMRPVIERFGMGFRPARPEDFHSMPGAVYYATARWCDCGTALGGALLPADPQEEANRARAERLRRKGWSEAKLARWREEKARAVTERGREAQEELETWAAFVPAVMRTGAAPWLGVFRHDYNKKHDSPQITLTGTVRLAVSDITAETFATLPEDFLYQFLPAL